MTPSMSNVKDFERLKKSVREAEMKAKEAEGARKVLMKQLKEDWGCSTLEEAKEKLAALRQESEALEDEALSALEAFQKLWEEFNDAN